MRTNSSTLLLIAFSTVAILSASLPNNAQASLVGAVGSVVHGGGKAVAGAVERAIDNGKNVDVVAQRIAQRRWGLKGKRIFKAAKIIAGSCATVVCNFNAPKPIFCTAPICVVQAVFVAQNAGARITSCSTKCYISGPGYCYMNPQGQTFCNYSA